MDLTDLNISQEVKLLLQLGDRFCTPLKRKDKDKFLLEYIKYIETNIGKCDEESKIDIRNKAIPILKDFYNNNIETNSQDKLILKWIDITKKFVKEHPEVIFTNADKGNVTVAINKFEYEDKMNLLLSDVSTYEIVRKDPTNKIINELRAHLNRWKSKEFINKEMFNWLMSSEGILPRAYGLPKIHKKDIPYRIIVSSINSPLYNIAGFLHDILNNSIQKPPSFIEDSFQFVKRMDGISMGRDYELVSLDVVSLFTNIPIDLAVSSLIKRWNSISRKTSFSMDEFIVAIKFVLNSTFFKFQDKIYRQTFGSPMGSPLSPIIANITLMDIEERALESLSMKPLFYFRYVDDVILAAHNDKIEEIVDVFNSFHDRIKFTCERAEEGQLSFLDVKVITEGENIITKWYHKPTFSGRYLNFVSQHPVAHKRGVIIGMVDRALKLSHPRFHQEDFNNIIKILIDNNYPLPFIFHNIRERLKYYFLNREDKQKKLTEKDNNKKEKYFTVPYVVNVSEKFSSMAKKHGFKISYSRGRDLRQYIKRHKDEMDRFTQSGVVYRINCLDCEATYIGQTKRKLETRVKEHKNDIKRSSSPSVISQHRIELDHQFDWEGVSIVDGEKSYSKRLTSEMLNIKRQTHGLNKQSDTEFLPESYTPILNLLPTL